MRPGDIETKGLGAGSYPEAPHLPEPPHCPICGAECETIYRTVQLYIVGCDMCLKAVSAYEEPECYSEP